MKKETKIPNPALPVAYHLEAPVVRGAAFAPFLGGSALKGPEEWSQGLLRDDLGADHVSTRNPHLSELSVLYAAWKNHPEWTHYGIAHYRRFMLARPTWVQRWLVQPEFRLWTDLDALTPAFTLGPEDLRGQQLLVSTTRTYRVPLRADYLRWHDSRDLAVLQEAMERHHPGMSKPWNRFLDTIHDLTPFNMMFGARAEVDRQYLETLARAAVATGIDGLFIEAHPCPSEALCDAASQLPLEALEPMVERLLAIDRTVKGFNEA